MIPFASQRGNGQDLAVHLSNEHDNESVEVFDLRGSVADDLPGAFAEWEVQAHNLTQCSNYLYSLSVNPDQRQGKLTREQYLDFVARTEEKLGLQEQPRALVFHIKNGREHLHAVYSRVDSENEKAIHMPFDHDKLMMVTREFARDWGLKLPEGYNKERGQHQGRGQLLLYEKNQQDTTGISKEERIAVVTSIWQQSDSPKAFVAGLENNGYILCTGDRDYVLVDYYGHMNALPRLIDDKQVRTKQLRAFLGDDFPREGLPDVEETRELLAEHRAQCEVFKETQAHQERQRQLEWAHKRRRVALEKEQAGLTKEQTSKQQSREEDHYQERAVLRSDYLTEKARINDERKQNQPTGLAAFLTKASGFAALQRTLHRREDNQRYLDYENEKSRLLQQQETSNRELQHQHDAQRYDIDRRLSALAQLEQRECQSLEKQHIKQQRVTQRQGVEHMPRLALELSPWKRKPNIHRAKHRHHHELTEHQKVVAEGERPASGKSSARPEFQDRAEPNEKTLPRLKPQFPNESEAIDIQFSEHDVDHLSTDDATKPKSNSKDKGKIRK